MRWDEFIQLGNSSFKTRWNYHGLIDSENFGLENFVESFSPSAGDLRIIVPVVNSSTENGIRLAAVNISVMNLGLGTAKVESRELSADFVNFG